MFTGLVETIGTLSRRSGGRVVRACFDARFKSEALSLGESIAVNGVCLTVDRITSSGFEADMSEETLARSTLGALGIGARVHLERATPPFGRLGGHIVAGHVDGVGEVNRRDARGDALLLGVRAPGDLSRFLAAKGSVAIDGVSLTLNEVRGAPGEGASIEVMLVPHTLGQTLLGTLPMGARVNIEVDVLARYVARWLEFRGAEGASASSHEGVSDDERLLQKLRSSGFV